MARTENNDATTEEQRAAEYYLPATAGLSSEPGPIERLVKSVFQRRGDFPALVSRRNR